MNDLHAQLYERLLQGEMDVHLGYKKNDPAGNNSGNSRNGSYPKTIQTVHGEHEIEVPRDRNGTFEPLAVPRHAHRGFFLEKLVISLYAKGMSVSDIEEEMRDIYQVNLSSSAISVITNKVTQAAIEWQNHPLESQYLIVWMEGIVFKVRDGSKVINKTVYLAVGLDRTGRSAMGQMSMLLILYNVNFLLWERGNSFRRGNLLARTYAETKNWQNSGRITRDLPRQ